MFKIWIIVLCFGKGTTECQPMTNIVYQNKDQCLEAGGFFQDQMASTTEDTRFGKFFCIPGDDKKESCGLFSCSK